MAEHINLKLRLPRNTGGGKLLISALVGPLLSVRFSFSSFQIVKLRNLRTSLSSSEKGAPSFKTEAKDLSFGAIINGKLKETRERLVLFRTFNWFWSSSVCSASLSLSPYPSSHPLSLSFAFDGLRRSRDCAAQWSRDAICLRVIASFRRQPTASMASVNCETSSHQHAQL